MWGRTCVRGHQEGQGTFGVTNSTAVLWGCHCRRMAQGWLHFSCSACPSFRLFPALLGSFQGFEDSGKFKFPFLGRLNQREAVVRLSRGCGYSGMQMLDLTKSCNF